MPDRPPYWQDHLRHRPLKRSVLTVSTRDGRLVRTVLRAMRVRSTSARHRIRHGLRDTATLAGRRPRPPVANERLRHLLIGYARVSTADGSQSLATSTPTSRSASATTARDSTAACWARPPGTCHLLRCSRQSAKSPRYGGGHAAVDCVPFHIEGRRSLDAVLVRARPPRRGSGQARRADRDGHSGRERTVMSEQDAFDRILASVHDATLDETRWGRPPRP